MLSHIPLGETEGHKSNEIVFVGSGGMRSVTKYRLHDVFCSDQQDDER